MKKAAVFFVGLFLMVLWGPSLGLAQVDHRSFRETDQCLDCHSYRDREAPFVDQKALQGSAHGKLPCISCHRFEAANPKQDTGKIYAQCVGCHGEAGTGYAESAHANSDYGPNCASCHGSHDILPTGNTDAKANTQNLSETCGGCHRKAQSQYEESFHGKAVALGSEKSPDCASCHGAHLVLSNKNPEALTSSARAGSLCARCHPGDALGTDAVEHYTMAPEGFGVPMYWVKKFFVWLILVVVGFFLIHIELDLWHKLRTRRS